MEVEIRGLTSWKLYLENGSSLLSHASNDAIWNGSIANVISGDLCSSENVTHSEICKTIIIMKNHRCRELGTNSYIVNRARVCVSVRTIFLAQMIVWSYLPQHMFD